MTDPVKRVLAYADLLLVKYVVNEAYKWATSTQKTSSATSTNQSYTTRFTDEIPEVTLAEKAEYTSAAWNSKIMGVEKSRDNQLDTWLDELNRSCVKKPEQKTKTNDITTDNKLMFFLPALREGMSISMEEYEELKGTQDDNNYLKRAKGSRAYKRMLRQHIK